MPDPKIVSNMARKMNFFLEQKNSCRVFGPEKSLLGVPEPSSANEVFVGRLPKNLQENELFNFFKTAGDIYNIRIFLNYDFSNKGYAFVKFKDEESAIHALLYNGRYIRHRRQIFVVRCAEKKILEIDLSQSVAEAAPYPSQRADSPKRVYEVNIYIL